MLRNIVYIILLTLPFFTQAQVETQNGFLCTINSSFLSHLEGYGSTQISAHESVCNQANRPIIISGSACALTTSGVNTIFTTCTTALVCETDDGFVPPEDLLTCPQPDNRCEDDDINIFGFGRFTNQICSSGCVKRCAVESGNAQCHFEPIQQQCEGPDRNLDNCETNDGFECIDEGDAQAPADANDQQPVNNDDFCAENPQSSLCNDNSDQDPNTDSNEDGDPTNDPPIIDIDNNETTINNETESFGQADQGENNSNDPSQLDTGQDQQGNQCDPTTGTCTAVSGTCQTPPVCSGSPIQCSLLNQVWYSRCGGTHSDLGNCEEPLECKSDPILCAQLRFDHINYCSTQLTEQQTKDPNNLANFAEGIDDGANYNGTRGEGNIDLSEISTQFDTSGLGLDRSCITDIDVDAGFVAFQIPLSQWCSVLQIAGSIVTLFGFITGVRIVGDAI